MATFGTFETMLSYSQRQRHRAAVDTTLNPRFTASSTFGAAMACNKPNYGLADFAVVVSSDFQTGGTWAGAVEALKAGWCPVFARDGVNVPKGNRELLKLGAASLPEGELSQTLDLRSWLRQHAEVKAAEPDLFD